MKCRPRSGGGPRTLGGLPGWYLPVSTPWASGENTTWPMPFRLAQREHLGLDHPPQQRVLRLARDDAVEAHVVGNLQGIGDLLGGPLGDADVVDLALPDQVVKGPQRLFERRLVVVAVGLVEVDVVRAEPAQRGVARSMMCLRDSPRSLGLSPTGQ